MIYENKKKTGKQANKQAQSILSHRRGKERKREKEREREDFNTKHKSLEYRQMMIYLIHRLRS